MATVMNYPTHEQIAKADRDYLYAMMDGVERHKVECEEYYLCIDRIAARLNYLENIQ